MSRGTEPIMFVVLLFTVLVSAFMVTRLRQVDLGSLAPKGNMKEAVENYQKRMRTTQMMLLRERF